MTDPNKSAEIDPAQNQGQVEDEEETEKPSFGQLPYVNQANDFSSGSHSVVTSPPSTRSKTYAQIQQRQFSSPRDNNFFVNLSYGLLSAFGGSAVIYPFLRASAFVSLHPDLPLIERVPKYIVALPKVIVEQGPRSLFQYFPTYASMVPVIALDLAIFYGLKSIFYPRRYFLESDIPLFSNVFLAGSSAILRYLSYQPLSEAYSQARSSMSQFHLKDLAVGMQTNLRNRIQMNGIGGLYEGMIRNLPGLVVFRGLQLGITETVLERTKYKKGKTSWVYKFFISYVATVFARFIAFPFDIVRGRAGEEGEASKNIKKYFDTLTSLFTREGTRVFKRAFTSAFQASGSSLALSFFFHLNDSQTKSHF